MALKTLKHTLEDIEHKSVRYDNEEYRTTMQQIYYIKKKIIG